MKRSTVMRGIYLAVLAAAYVCAAQWSFAANSFYNASGSPATGSTVSSAVIRTEFANIGAGFDKMPALTANTAIVVNGTGTGLGNTVGTLALAGNFATTGAFNTTFVQQASATFTLPAATDTLVGRTSTDTLANKSISGSANTITNIGNAALTNSSVTIGSTSVSLGGTATTLAGLTLTTPTIAQIINSGTLTLPTSTDTLVGKATPDVFTNKTFDTAGAGNVFKINGTTVSDKTGTGKVVLDTNPVITGATVNGSTLAVPTRQVLTSGSGATYTTPAGVRQLRIRMVGGGGGGGGWNGAGSGTGGGTTTFKDCTALGGGGGGPGANTPSFGASGLGGTGGSNGTGTTGVFRTAGQDGQSGVIAQSGTPYADGIPGGSSILGGGSSSGARNASGYGGGGAGGSSNSGLVQGTAGGGGAGEYVEFIINSPSATYTYTVGGGGAGDVIGSVHGTNGKSGVIIVDEVY